MHYYHFRVGLLLALLLPAPVRLFAYPIPEIGAKTKPAIVGIVTIDEKGSTNRLGPGQVDHYGTRSIMVHLLSQPPLALAVV